MQPRAASTLLAADLYQYALASLFTCTANKSGISHHVFANFIFLKPK